MSETLEVLQRKIQSARELGSVVRMMKVLAAASIIQYERAMHSLSDYYHAVELGLSLCLQGIDSSQAKPGGVASSAKAITTAIAFGSDQGLVGQFNDTLADFVLTKLNELPVKKHLGGRRANLCAARECRHTTESALLRSKFGDGDHAPGQPAIDRP
jgi:F-type H+-transporting ATPase subunit gamma